MRKIILILLLVAPYFQLLGQECPEPTDLSREYYSLGDITVVNYIWIEPESACDSISYELEYGPEGFIPGQSQGTLISPILDQPGGNFSNFLEIFHQISENYTDAYMRSVCICDTTQIGTGNENSASGWVAFGPSQCWCEELYTESAEYSLTILNADEVYYCEEDVPNQTYEFIGEPIDKWGTTIVEEYHWISETQIDENTTIVESTVEVFHPYCDLNICDIGELLLESNTWTYTITYDNESPIVDCSGIITEYESENNFSIPDLSDGLIVDESCSYTVEQNPLPGETLTTGEHQLVFTVTDASGNVTSCETSIYVNAPDFSFEANLESYEAVECGDEIPQLEYSLGQSWEDGIANSTYFLEETENTELTACGELITHTISITNTELELVSANTFEIEILDSTPPVWNSENPTQLEISCENMSEIAMPIATDNCFENVEISFVENIVDGGCTPTIIREYIATDGCGNFSLFTQAIDIVDDVSPVFETDVEDFTVVCGAIIPLPENIVATDNCSDTVEIDFTETTEDVDCNSVITRTWIATDECDNFSILTQTIMIMDTVAPEISICPDEILIPLNEDGLYEIEDYSDLIEAEDNCTEELSISQSLEPSITDDTSIQSLTITIQDECGNSASCDVALMYEIGGNLIEKNPLEFNLFPNPSNGSFTIDLLVLSDAKFKIHNSLGQEVAQLNLVNGKNVVNLENLNTGLYIGYIRGEDGNKTGIIELIIE